MGYGVQFIVRNGSDDLHFFYSIIGLPYLYSLLQLILVNAHSSVCCLILSLFPCIL
jgi:hypothetical protein